MDSVLDWGLDVVLWFQELSPTLDLLFKALTFIGGEGFFLLLLPLVYWCLDRVCGVRLAVLFLLSGYINVVAKAIADQPRPFEYDHRVRQLVGAHGGGFPSGHTQNTVVIWGYLASVLHKKWFWIVALLLMVLVPLSRVYLGVHFPSDLLGGYLIGAMFLLLFMILEPKVESWLSERGMNWQLGLAVIGPLVLMLTFLTEQGITASAVLMGMGIGFVLERRWIGFTSGGIWQKRVIRFLLGIMILLVLWEGLSLVSQNLFFCFVRCTMIGLWCSVGAPWIFMRLNLVDCPK
ncbi:MAG: phosphatase PAP2 family protein [Chloroflexota bacterium]|nr:phosphatase PAP2 family protein [Chloroflexota bacterium]